VFERRGGDSLVCAGASDERECTAHVQRRSNVAIANTSPSASGFQVVTVNVERSIDDQSIA
jgi:hypothetical protein